MAGDQSNSVAFLNDRYVLKLFRRIEPAPNPEFEIGRFLTEREFPRTPPLGGRARVLTAGTASPARSVGAPAVVKHQGSGWDFTHRRAAPLLRAGRRARQRSDGQDGRAAGWPAEGQRDGTSRAAAVLRRARTVVSGAARRRSAGGPRSCTSRWPTGTEPGVRARAARRATPRRARATRCSAHVGASLDLLRAAGRRSTGRARGHRPNAVLASRDCSAGRWTRSAALDDARLRIRDPRRLSSRAGAAHRRGFRHPRLRGRAGAVDRRAARQAVAAEGRRRHAPIVQLRGLCGAVRVHVHAPGRLRALEPWADTWQHWVSDAFLRDRGHMAVERGRRVLPATCASIACTGSSSTRRCTSSRYELNNRPDWVASRSSGC